MGEQFEPMHQVPLLGKEYFEITRSYGPSETLVGAIQHTQGREAALDLGSGSGRDTIFLLGAGFDKVDAVDSHPEAARFIELLPEDSRHHLEFHQTTFDDFDFGIEVYDVMNAQNSLAFNPRDTFEEMFGRLKASLRPGGIFVGNFFGDRDEWNTSADSRIYLTKGQVAALFSDMEMLAFEEVDDPEGVTARGTKKHWHRFYVVAQRHL